MWHFWLGQTTPITLYSLDNGNEEIYFIAVFHSRKPLHNHNQGIQLSTQIDIAAKVTLS